MAENFNDDQAAPVALLLWDGTKWTRFTTTTTIPVSLSGVATEATLASILTELGAKLEDGGNVVVTSLPAITGTVTANAGTNLNTSLLATAANQLPDSHNVTVDNASGASAVNIQDGGNAITTDWAGVAPPIGGGTEATALKVTIASDSTGVLSVDDNGSSITVDGTVALTDINAGEYETVAASQTAQVLGATGATGDWVSGLLVIPATTSPGNVVLLDNATSITVFTGGASSVTNLVPFFIPLGMKSVSGAWKVTTGANVSVIGIGNFT